MFTLVTIKGNEEKMEQQQKLSTSLPSLIQTLQQTVESSNKKSARFEAQKGTGAKRRVRPPRS